MKYENIRAIWRFENNFFEECIHTVMVVVYATGFSMFVLELQALFCSSLEGGCSCSSRVHGRVVGRG